MNHPKHGSNVKHRINMIMNVIDLLQPFPPTTCHISQGNRRTSKPKPSLSMSRFNQLIKVKRSTKDMWIYQSRPNHM